jgi:nucleoside triphosphate pyrophosphatase
MRGVLYLASTSPRRRELLDLAGIGFRLHPPGPECEGTGEPGERARMRARSKSVEAPVPARPGWILGVDTVVSLERDGLGPVELGKPADRASAEAMLRRLADREHEVITAHCLFDPATWTRREECATSRVRCTSLADHQIEAYLDTGDWSDKAGAYGIQSVGAAFMELVEGDLDTVIGLNIAAVRRLVAGPP